MPRWDALFADLEAQSAALERAELAAEVDERTRGEIGTLSLVDRLRAAADLPVRVQLAGGLAVAGTLERIGPDWLLISEQAGQEALVASAALVRVHGLPRFSAVPDSMGVVESRLGLRHALRALARDRSASRLHLVDGSTVDATLDRIGADFVEAAAHPAGEARRRQDVRDVHVVRIAALAAVRRLG